MYDGKTLLCRTQYNGNSVAGRILLSPKSVDVRLVGFEDFVYFKRENEISLELEDNQFCTVTPFSTSSGAYSKSHFLDVNVRQAIIGFRPWSGNDVVKEFQFKLSDTNMLLIAPDIESGITQATFENPPETTIIEAESNGTTVTISFSHTLGYFDESNQVGEVVGKVAFEDAKTIAELGDLVGILRTFFTMAAGIEVWLSDYWVVPKEDCEQPLLGGGSTSARFQLIWPHGKEGQLVDYDSFIPSSVLRSGEESDRKTTSDCLKFWMDNWAEWQHAFSGVLVATQAGMTYDSNRILSACKWLESTPDAKQRELGRGNKLDDITAAAIAKARELGLNIDGRISGAIERLGTESRNDLFKRLIELVVPEDDPALKKRFLKDLHKAYRIRGEFAHFKFYHTGGEEFGGYIQAVRAVEALAFLLLFRRLPIPEDHPWLHGPYSFTEYLRLPPSPP